MQRKDIYSSLIDAFEEYRWISLIYNTFCMLLLPNYHSAGAWKLSCGILPIYVLILIREMCVLHVQRYRNDYQYIIIANMQILDCVIYI